jgi:peroxiredoxin
MIQPGDRVPSVSVKLVDASGVTDTTTDAMMGQGLVVLFAVPGAFTPTCDTNHLPGFLANAPKFRARGVSRVVCVSVNDHHVMKAWAEASGALGLVDFLADGNAEFARALGLAQDRSAANMGERFVRSALLIEDGVATDVFVETVPGVNATGAPAILMALDTRGRDGARIGGALDQGVADPV